MKTFVRQTIFASILGALILIARTCNADPQQVFVAVKDLQTQQKQIADNQTKIEAKVAEAVEAIRVARLYTGRLGGAHKPPPPPK
jgi:outer membrane murein-binding lipoprotein Lpp